MKKMPMAFGALMGLLALACGGGAPEGGEGEVAGAVEADGSSTVFPIAEAVAEEFMATHQGQVRVTVGISGTGGGFKRFCAGETDINNASRPIKDSERQDCEAAGVTPVEMPVAYDGLTVVVSPENDWAQCLTVEELHRVWEPGSQISNWSEVREGFPDVPLKLYGPGTDSGTFDYFTEAIMGEEDASRADYTASEDDNVLVTGVQGDRGAMGYFGYAYYEENAERLKALEIDGGNGCVAPRPETINDGTYAPLSRPIFIYVAEESLQRPAVQEYVRFFMENAAELVREVGYIALEPELYQENLTKVPGGAQAAPEDGGES